MNLLEKLKQGARVGSLLGLVAVNGCIFNISRQDNKKISYFTWPFSPVTFESYEVFNEDNEIVAEKRMTITEIPFGKKKITIENYVNGKYTGKYVIKKETKLVGFIQQRRHFGGRAKRLTGASYGERIAITYVYDSEGNFIKQIQGIPNDVPKNLPFW